MSDAWAGCVFEFEEIEALKLLPLAARRALDVGGFRLSLEGWQSLALRDRESLVLEGAKDAVDQAAVESVVRRSSIPATRIRPVPDPDPLSPPEQLNAALTSASDGARAIEPAAWSRLRALDRYALVHVLRRSIAHDDLHRLETAVATVMGRDRIDRDKERERSSLAAELKRTLKSAMGDAVRAEVDAARSPRVESARPPPAADKTEKTEIPFAPRAADVGPVASSPAASAPPAIASAPAVAPAPAPSRGWRAGFSSPDIEITNGLPTVTDPPPAMTARLPSSPPPRPERASVKPAPPDRTPTPEAPLAAAAPPESAAPPTTRPGSEHPRAAAPGLGTHVDQQGHVHMVDIGSKDETLRRAKARGSVRMKRETALRLAQRDTPKGEVLATARIAGIMAAKRTSELIPLCHAIALTHVEIHIDVDANAGIVNLTAVAEARDRTGVEMEALTAVSVAGLTIYDMLKGIDRELVLGETRLLEKSGGRSGPLTNEG